jgi:tripartite-type tricarboxylate transporter receptor subunit TctC
MRKQIREKSLLLLPVLERSLTCSGRCSGDWRQQCAVPYKGAQQPVTDLIAGQVQMYSDTVALFLPHIHAAKVKPLAIADDMRSDQLPARANHGRERFSNAAGDRARIVAPMGTPADIVNMLNAAISEILRSPELEASLAQCQAENRFSPRLH